jgi:hypothetical protein
MQRMEQGEKKMAWGLHLFDVERQRPALDKGTQQSRFAYAFGTEYQERLAYLLLAAKTADFFFPLHANQIFAGRLTLCP